MRGFRIMVALVLAVVHVGCDRPAPAPRQDAAPAVSASAPAVPAAVAVRFAVDPFGAAVFVARPPSGAKGQEIKGIAKAFAGEIEVTPSDLRRTRGSVAVDLSGISTHGGGDDAVDAATTARVREALEVGKEPFRWARFTLRSVEDMPLPNLLELSPEVRMVTLKTTGDLELHGVKREAHVDLELTLSPSTSAPAAVTLRSASPIVVSLAAHGVSPGGREPIGDEVIVTFEASARAVR